MCVCVGMCVCVCVCVWGFHVVRSELTASPVSHARFLFHPNLSFFLLFVFLARCDEKKKEKEKRTRRRAERSLSHDVSEVPALNKQGAARVRPRPPGRLLAGAYGTPPGVVTFHSLSSTGLQGSARLRTPSRRTPGRRQTHQSVAGWKNVFREQTPPHSPQCC